MARPIAQGNESLVMSPPSGEGSGQGWSARDSSRPSVFSIGPLLVIV